MGNAPSKAFRLQGWRVSLTRWIEGCGPDGPFVVRVKAEAVVPDEDPSEPCFEPDTVRWLEEVQRLADSGDVAALAKVGDIYVRRSA